MEHRGIFWPKEGSPLLWVAEGGRWEDSRRLGPDGVACPDGVPGGAAAAATDCQPLTGLVDP